MRDMTIFHIECLQCLIHVFLLMQDTRDPVAFLVFAISVLTAQKVFHRSQIGDVKDVTQFLLDLFHLLQTLCHH